TDEAQTAVALAIAAQVADALLHGVVVNAVNLPSIDAETSREQAPWYGLAEKMGRFLAQMAEGRMQEARLTYSGEIAGRSIPTLTLALVRGLIGRIGTLCGRDGINIAGMQLGRERRGGRAVSILNLDDPMPPAALDEIRAMPDIVFAKLVKL